nr:hypothetical protein [Tanacetum cinerariifolium]
MKIEYWIINTDHNLWKIVQNGNNKKSLGRDSKGGIIILPPVSFKEHARFGGNEKSKKIRKTMHKAENKTEEGEQVYGLMARIKLDFADHAGNAAGSVYDAAA